ncbi:MAG: FIST signal transduction protein [Candidatus Omnitrophota bacterium]
MKIEQRIWTKEKGWSPALSSPDGSGVELVILFGSTALIKEKQQFQEIKKIYPNASWIGCSTAGEIYGTQVHDDSLVLTAVHFEKTKIKCVHQQITNINNSYEAGGNLAQQLNADDLKHIFVLSEGINVNGSELVRGFNHKLLGKISVSGGLSGDAARFKETFIISDGEVYKEGAVAVGFYGNNIKVGYGSLGGWDSFGPERVVTKSRCNKLYELDGQLALNLYKQYLGEHAKGLPATGLLFPLSLSTKSGEKEVVRTILAVDEKEQSMTFAGDIPENSTVRLMKANFNRLVDGAVGAAKNSLVPLDSMNAELSILISCVGRKLILKQRTEEEVEGVRDVVGGQSILTGFYSYGEIAPFGADFKECQLHNQTMTITTFSEKV